MLIDRLGRVFVGWRKDFSDRFPDGANWQMPQGGIDVGEEPRAAALRELFEETGVRSVRVLAESAEWQTYLVPHPERARALRGRYRGQRQKWFLIAFEGSEAEIDVLRPGGGTARPEFSAWRWADLDELPSLVVAFKRSVYEAVAAEFAPLVRAHADAAGAAPLTRSPPAGG
jgi:putative (di)nucleoside polyphosphate hydrolase